MTHLHQPMAWLVLHACAQPCHPAETAIDTYFALIRPHQHRIAVYGCHSEGDMHRYWQYRRVGSAKWFLAEFGRPGDILNSVYSIFRSIAQQFMAILILIIPHMRI